MGVAPAPTFGSPAPSLTLGDQGSGGGPGRAGLFAAIVAVGALGAFLAFGPGGDDDEASVVTTVPVATLPTTDTTVADSVTDVPLSATVADLARSTVQVVLLLGDEPTCSGSGTIIDERGTILTNAHVIEPDSSCPYDRIGIAVTDDAGSPPELLYVAEVYAYDPIVDLAVIRIATDLDGVAAPGPFVSVPVGDSDAVEIGDSLRILGYPSIGGETVTFTNGVVSGFASQNGVGSRSWIKTDATIAGGNSGGAAFDLEGRLVGIPTQAAASDTGAVVDCRVITDTNGDGAVDGLDQCVPIGGFLNGLRPVNLAEPLIAQAATGSPIDIDDVAPEQTFTGVFDVERAYATNPGWSLEASDDPGFTTDFLLTAQAGTEQLCFWFDWEGFPDGAEWDGVWSVDGVVNENFSFFGEIWNAGDEGVGYWLCASDGDGLVAGLYEFIFYIEEQAVFHESIRLTPAPAPLHEVTFVNSAARPVCYLYTGPMGSVTSGLDELAPTEVIEPGQSKVIRVPEGTIIADAYDCAGTAMFENYEGLDVTGPVTIDVTG